MYQKLTKVNWIFVCLILLGLRALIDANLSQALIVAVLGGLEAFRQFRDTQKHVALNDDVQRQLDEMKNAVAGLSMKSAVRPAQMEQEVRRFF